MPRSKEFQEPFPEVEFEEHLKRMKESCSSALLEFKKFEAEKDANSAHLCLHRFALTVGILTDYSEHPSDMDRVMADKEFVTQLQTLVEDIKNADIIKFLEGNRQRTPAVLSENEMFRRYLISAEIYLAGR